MIFSSATALGVKPKTKINNTTEEDEKNTKSENMIKDQKLK
jgi:hypothetical protein